MKKQIIGLAAASLIAFSAQASDVSFNYAELGYVSIDPDDSGDNLDGFFLSGVKAVNETFHVYADFDSTSLSEANEDIDSSKLQIGFGVNYEISPSTDLVAQLGYAKNDVEFCEDFGSFGNFCDKEDDSGIAVNLGIRALLSPAVELSGRLKYEDVWITGNTTNFEFAGVYLMENNIALKASFEVGEFAPDVDANTLRLSVRYNF